MKYTDKKMAQILKALGDPTRLKIIKLLSAKGKILCVGALAHELGITQPAVSQHLKVLKNIGLLDDNRVGFHVHYCVNADALKACKKEFDALFMMLHKCCCGPCDSDTDT